MNLIFSFSQDLSFAGVSGKFRDSSTGNVFTAPVNTADATVSFPTSSLQGSLQLFNNSDGTLIMRTGQLNNIPALAGGQWNDFYFVKAPAANPVTVSAASISSGIGALPIKSGSNTITALGITLGNGNITAAGSATHVTSVFGFNVSTPVTFSYVFSLVPDTSDDTTKVLDVKTKSTTVKSTSGGLLGFLVNFFTDLIISAVMPSIVSAIQSVVQSKVNASLLAQAKSQGVPTGTTVTVQSVSITPAAVLVNAFGAVSIENACSTGPTSGSIKSRPQEEVDFLYQVRDKLLADSPRGKAYIDTFYAHNAELLRIFLQNPDILKKVDELVKIFRTEFAMENIKTAMLSAGTAAKVKDVMTSIQKVASDRLKNVIDANINDIADFTGKVAKDVLNDSWKLYQKM